jgi:hypothetical protein
MYRLVMYQDIATKMWNVPWHESSTHNLPCPDAEKESVYFLVGFRMLAAVVFCYLWCHRVQQGHWSKYGHSVYTLFEKFVKALQFLSPYLVPAAP